MSGRPIDEFDSEPVRGLPEPLPEGEEILWQGAPSWRGFARHVFHLRKLAVYFAVLLVWRVASPLGDGQAPSDAAVSAAGPALLVLTALGLVALLAWLHSRSTVYTITNRRVVMRFGVAFVMALNLPFRAVQSAGLRQHEDGTGDIPLEVTGTERVGYLMLWPHARPWRFGARVQPMLRAIPEAETVAELLARGLAESAKPAREEREPHGPLGSQTPLVAAS